MTALIENIRKFMGWCPNATAIVMKKSLQFDDLTLNAPDREGKSTHVGADWLNKYRNRVLLELLFVMYLAVVSFDGYGKFNPDMYLIGVISGLFFHFSIGVNDWHRFNRAAGRVITQPQTTRKQRAIAFLGIISLIVFIVFLITKITGGMAFISGTMVFFWIKYIEVLHWERKNGKMLIVKRTSFYAVDTITMRTEQ